MISMLRVLSALIAVTAGVASAQTAPAATSDSTTPNPNAVTGYSIRSGKLMLSTKANPKPTILPDGRYTNEEGVILVLIDGRITRVQESTGGITEIASMRLSRQQRVMLTPSTNALMAVSEVPLASGTFKSEDGRSMVTIVLGRPTEFALAGSS